MPKAPSRTTSIIDTTFTDRWRQATATRHLSITEMADRSGLSRPHLSRILGGHASPRWTVGS